ncbi:MAG: biotin--[acetyl-CoA-carboxylase] ligase [Nitrospinota bacterium]
MDGEKILAGLKTQWLGKFFSHINETTSTNDYAKKLFEEGKLEHGAVIIADRQTAGRGRMERRWHSDGGLCMTVCVRFSGFAPGELISVTLAAGVAVANALRKLCDAPIYVKYPNDIIANGKKLGGILTELKGKEPRMVLLGIGVNVFGESFHEEIADTAVSLRQLGVGSGIDIDIDIDIEMTAIAIINGMEIMMDLFRESGFKAALPLWNDINCTLGNDLTVAFPNGRTIKGTAKEIGEDGALLIDTGEGLRRVTSGDIFQ